MGAQAQALLLDGLAKQLSSVLRPLAPERFTRKLHYAGIITEVGTWLDE
jgi:hypothetical protein